MDSREIDWTNAISVSYWTNELEPRQRRLLVEALMFPPTPSGALTAERAAEIAHELTYTNEGGKRVYKLDGSGGELHATEAHGFESGSVVLPVAPGHGYTVEDVIARFAEVRESMHRRPSGEGEWP